MTKRDASPNIGLHELYATENGAYKIYRAYRAAKLAGLAYGGIVLGKYGLEYMTNQQMEQKGTEVANDLIDRAESNSKKEEKTKTEATQEKKTNPKKEAREKGKKESQEKNDSQPDTEKRTNEKAKELEKARGKDARREAHNKKDNGDPDRNRKQVDEDYDPNNYKPRWERTDRDKR